MSVLTTEEFNSLLASNPDFKKEFIANPKPVLAQLGATYPDSVKVHVIESAPNDLVLILGTPDIYTPERLAEMPPQVGTVLNRTFTDPAFKALLLSDPVEAIFLETGYRFPESMKVRVFEDTSTDAYYALPSRPADTDDEELSDLELEQVAGGKGDPVGDWFSNAAKDTGNWLAGAANSVNNATQQSGYGGTPIGDWTSKIANAANCPGLIALMVPTGGGWAVTAAQQPIIAQYQSRGGNMSTA